MRYPKLAGTNVPRDFVEFPSQVNEMWVLHPEVLPGYARHVETGEPLPADVADRLRATETYGQGFATTEYLAATVLDQAWHRLSVEEADAVTDVAAFEAEALAAAGLDLPGGAAAVRLHLLRPRVRRRLQRRVLRLHLERGARRGHRRLVRGARRPHAARTATGSAGSCSSRGNAEDPIDAYRAFRGRDAAIEPLLARRGLD